MKLLLISCFLLLQWNVYSQDWGTYYSDDNLTIEVAKVTYEDKSHNQVHERIVLKYTNKTNQELSVSLTRIHAYDGAELQVSPEREFSITLTANETKGYSDETEKNKLFYIFKKDMNNIIKRKLSSFDIANIVYLEL